METTDFTLADKHVNPDKPVESSVTSEGQSTNSGTSCFLPYTTQQQSSASLWKVQKMKERLRTTETDCPISYLTPPLKDLHSLEWKEHLGAYFQENAFSSKGHYGQREEQQDITSLIHIRRT